MILCSCGNDIKYFIAVARPHYSGRNIILSNGAYFTCSECCHNILKQWQNFNKERIVKYIIQTAKVTVKTDTKKEFAKMALPQIINQFDWYVPKTDIKRALRETTKG